jgi:hypothetical protein
MKVFISWSGATSRAVAEALSAWLPKVLQGVEPFVSAKDIDKGSNWTVELARELEDTEFGIICLAPDNLLSPWLNYETGAITKSVNSRVCPVLFEVEKAEVKPPLAQLQLTSIDKDDFLLLMASMNKVAGSLIGAEALKEAVEVWWPRLEKEIKAITKPETQDSEVGVTAEPAKPDVDIVEMIAEVLHRVRKVDERVSRIERGGRSSSRKLSPQEEQLSNAVTELMMVATECGLSCHSAAHGPSSIDLKIEGDIPPILPMALFDAAIETARKLEIRVRVVGKNRTAVFEKGGRTDEDPF